MGVFLNSYTKLFLSAMLSVWQLNFTCADVPGKIFSGVAIARMIFPRGEGDPCEEFYMGKFSNVST